MIARLAARLPRTDAVLLGPGDDAAVLRAPDARVVATTDLLVEGRHFRRDWSDAYDVGRKAAAQNLADVAAMGAVPTALLLGFGAPPDLPVGWAERLADGLRDECALVGAAVAGGDVVRADTVVLAVTALGDLAGAAPVTRAGACPGDVVAVAGRLGHAAAGLALLSAGLAQPAELLAAHRRPAPPYEQGPAAARLGATAMLDVSDGLVQDLGHVAAASGVRIDIDSALLVVPEPLREAAAALAGRRQAADPLAWILTGGEDHALAATFPTPPPAPWRVVGRVRAGLGVFVDGRPIAAGGWDHFG